MGHVKFGPRPPTHAPLSDGTLRLLHALLTSHELKFLFAEFQTLYPELPRDQAKIQGVSFEILCLAAGLKESVIVGWGDGTDEQGHGKVAVTWLKRVWEETRAVLEAQIGNSERSGQDAGSLQRWMDGIRVQKLGSVSGGTAVFTGHYLLYHPPASPALSDILSISLVCQGDESLSEPVELDDSIWAYVLDYPTIMPPDEYFHDDKLRREKVGQVNIYQEFTDGPLMGTEYFCSTSLSDVQSVRAHFQRYQQRLRNVLDLSLHLNGIPQEQSVPRNTSSRSLRDIVRSGANLSQKEDNAHSP
jgi:hypothetical protein